MPRTNPFDKEKDPQRFEDWNSGYIEGLKIHCVPGAGDTLAGILARVALESFNPKFLKSLDKLGLAPGTGIKVEK